MPLSNRNITAQLETDHDAPAPGRALARYSTRDHAAHGNDLSVHALPRQRFRSRMRRSATLLLLFQSAATLVAFVVIQGLWREDPSSTTAAPLARTASETLAVHPLAARNATAQRILDRMTESPPIAFATVVDESGRVVLHSENRAGAHGSSLPEPLRGLIARRGWLDRIIPLERIVVTETHLPSFPGADRTLVLGVHDPGRADALLAGGAAIALGAIVTWLIPMTLVHRRFRRWTTGLHELHTATRRLALECPITPVAVTGDDEIAYLSLAFNDMAGRIAAGRRALISANTLLEQRVASRTEELRQANALLEQQNVKLANLTDTALRFTDDVAHEFRTPLTVIAECAAIISEGLTGTITPQQAELTQFITGASGQLSELIDDFLDSSKIRSGTLRIDRRVHEVSAVVDSVWPMLARRAAASEVTLKRDLSTDLPPVFADLGMAGRALVNLVVNAVKFSRAGTTVTVTARREGDHAVALSVRDQGPGLSEEEADVLFERFGQTAAGRSGDAKGFGLGLSIVRDLVDINLGTVSVQSDIGQGSCFTFTLPTHDEAAVIGAACRRIRAIDPDAAVGLLIVKPAGGERPPEELRGLLASCGAASDVQILCRNLAGVLVIGPTTDIAAWRARIIDEYRRADPGSARDGLDIDAVGEWPVDEAERRALSVTAGDSPGPDAPTANRDRDPSHAHRTDAAPADHPPIRSTP